MEYQPRLTRTQVLERLRAHAARHGFASSESLYEHDRIVLRSLMLHFPGLHAARFAAGVPGPPYRKPRTKTGPKPGGKFGRRPRLWSCRRVLDELRRWHRAGKSTAWADLMQAGKSSLIHAATVYAGGLANARKSAGLGPLKRRVSKKDTWSPDKVVRSIASRRKRGQSLASSGGAPQSLVTAGRWHFGSWGKALAAADVDVREVRRPPGMKYTKAKIIARLRRAVREGSDLQSKQLVEMLSPQAVRREFGSVPAAIRAAGLAGYLEIRTHGQKKWTRERLIDELRARAARGVHTFTSRLHAAAQKYFGGSEVARAAAGVPSPLDLRIEQRRRAKRQRARSSRRVRSIEP